MPGARLRFMSAIWNSYSKSLTARRPRTITVAPTAMANSASSPSKERTSTLGSWTARRIKATRSSSVKSGCFATFTATATITRSARSEEHTSELQSRLHLVCRLLLEKKKKQADVPDELYSHRSTSMTRVYDVGTDYV